MRQRPPGRGCKTLSPQNSIQRATLTDLKQVPYHLRTYQNHRCQGVNTFCFVTIGAQRIISNLTSLNIFILTTICIGAGNCSTKATQNRQKQTQYY